MSNSCCSTKEALAMASFPMQEWCAPYDWPTALKNGTIFPCLNMEFYLAEKLPCPTCGASAKPDREAAMQEINDVSFAVNDLTLYLDTHPQCKEGLSLLKELLEKRLQLLTDYAAKYNPLTQISMITGAPETTEYGWGEGPAPWEGGLL